MRDNISTAAFKYGGKITVVGYITNKVMAQANSPISTFSSIGNSMNTLTKVFFENIDEMYIVHPVAIYYGDWYKKWGAFYESKFLWRNQNILTTARNKVYQTANFAMVEAYWNIGKSIIEEQGGDEKAEYGTGLLKELLWTRTYEWRRQSIDWYCFVCR